VPVNTPARTTTIRRGMPSRDRVTMPFRVNIRPVPRCWA
jgi:hypothetical protein